MSAAATSSATGDVAFFDRIYIAGTAYKAGHAQGLLHELPKSAPAQLTFNQTIDPTEKQYGMELRIEQPWFAYGATTTAPTIKATNGQNYSPPLPNLADTALSSSHDVRLNRFRISEKDQPEAVALTKGSELLVGQGEIYRAVATTDAVWAFCSDGLYRISGEYPDWRVDPFDPTLVLAGNNAVDVMQGIVWAYTNRGLVAISDSGVQEVSEGVLAGPTGLLPGEAYTNTSATSVVCDETNREVHVFFVVTNASYSVVFNTAQKSFTTTDLDRAGSQTMRSLAYVPYLRSNVWGLEDDVMRHTVSAVGMAAPRVQFQPVVGVDAFSLSRWIDCTYRFGAATPFAVRPSFSGLDFPADVLATMPAANAPVMAAVPVELSSVSIGLEATCSPGFTIPTGYGQLWTFRGLALRFIPASERLTR